MMYMHHATSSVGAECACTTLRKASRAVTRMYDEALHERGMTTVQFSILRNLARHDAMPLTRLADLLVMERTTLYRALSPLQRQAWVRVTEGPGRTKVATLTKQGGRALQGAVEAWEGVQARLLAAVGGRDYKELAGVLERLIAATRGRAP
jgi:DNA-binding MarR family transcriptional regulator